MLPDASRLGSKPQGTEMTLQRSAKALDVRIPLKRHAAAELIRLTIFLLFNVAFGIGSFIFLWKVGPAAIVLVPSVIILVPSIACIVLCIFLWISTGEETLHLDVNNVEFTNGFGTKQGRTSDVFRASVVYTYFNGRYTVPTHVKIHVGVQEYLVGRLRLDDTEAEWIVAEFNGLLQQFRPVDSAVVVGQPVPPLPSAPPPPPLPPQVRPLEVITGPPVADQQMGQESMLDSWLDENRK